VEAIETLLDIEIPHANRAHRVFFAARDALNAIKTILYSAGPSDGDVRITVTRR
jgi:hypothetical protein